EADEYVFAARLETCIGYTVAELGVEHREARAAERYADVGMGAARRGVGREVGAHAAVEPGQHWGRIAQLGCDRDVVTELAEVAAHRPRDPEGLRPRDTGRVAGWERRDRVGIGAGIEVAAEIFKARTCLKRIVKAVGKPAVNAGGWRLPGRG